MKKKLIIVALILLFLVIAVVATALTISAEYLIGVAKSKVIKSSIEDAPGEAPENTYPLILLHGLHLTYNQRISEFTFKEMQSSLSEDLNYLDRGILTPQTTCAELRYSENPIVIRTTYLEAFELKDIDGYSENLNKIIEKIKFCTGADSVDIVAHSMGGVVARNYIKNHDDTSVRKLIMLGTPNNGGLYNIAEIADILTKEGNSIIGLDFIELSENHEFMINLNKEDKTPNKVQLYTIAGNTDGKGDGIVTEESVKMSDSLHYTVECGHLAIKDPSRCPESFEFVKEALNKN